MGRLEITFLDSLKMMMSKGSTGYRSPLALSSDRMLPVEREETG